MPEKSPLTPIIISVIFSILFGWIKFDLKRLWKTIDEKQDKRDCEKQQQIYDIQLSQIDKYFRSGSNNFKKLYRLNDKILEKVVEMQIDFEKYKSRQELLIRQNDERDKQ